MKKLILLFSLLTFVVVANAQVVFTGDSLKAYYMIPVDKMHQPTRAEQMKTTNTLKETIVPLTPVTSDKGDITIKAHFLNLIPVKETDKWIEFSYSNHWGKEGSTELDAADLDIVVKNFQLILDSTSNSVAKIETHYTFLSKKQNFSLTAENVQDSKKTWKYVLTLRSNDYYHSYVEFNLKKEDLILLLQNLNAAKSLLK